MKRNLLKWAISLFLLIFLVAFCFFVLGCGQGVLLPEKKDEWISSRFPAIGGSVNSRNFNLTITFARDMDTNYMSVITGEGHNAGDVLTAETYWIDNRTFNVSVTGPLFNGTGNTVQILSDTGGFRDSHGNMLPARTELWRFNYNYNTLESYSISGNISQSYGTLEGTIYITAYDHEPSGYGDMGFIGMTSMETTGAYTLTDLGHGTRYVRAYRDGFGAVKWYNGFPSGNNGPVDISSGNAAGKNIDLAADHLAVVSVTPSIGQENVPSDYTISITFNNAIAPWTLDEGAFNFGASHEAGMPITSSTPEISSDLRTFSIHVLGFQYGHGPWVEVTTPGSSRILDANGDHLTDGSDLWKYKLATYSVSGTVSGGTTGETVYVGATTTFEITSFDDFFAFVSSEANPYSYTIPGLIQGPYYIFAFRDEVGSGWVSPESDYIGQYIYNPIEVTSNQSGVDITLTLGGP